MKAKIRHIITEEVIEVHTTIEHADSSYKHPVWVDEENNSYGQCHLGAPIGFEIIEVAPDFKF